MLAHRRVKTLVFYDEGSQGKLIIPQAQAPYWFRFGDDARALSGLPLHDQADYYYAAVVGMPRNLLEPLIANLPAAPQGKGALDYEMRLGTMDARLGYDPTGIHPNPHFIPYTPRTGVTPADLRIDTPATASSFVYSNQPLPAAQIYFIRQLGALAKSHGCNLVELHLPVLAERSLPVIPETRHWPDFLQTEVSVMGIPPARLFAGLSLSEIQQLYFDDLHFNVNGKQYFTPLITPAILQCYEHPPTR